MDLILMYWQYKTLLYYYSFTSFHLYDLSSRGCGEHANDACIVAVPAAHIEHILWKNESVALEVCTRDLNPQLTWG